MAECKELRGFLEEKEQLLLSRLEELDRDIVKRRDESVSRLSEEIAQLDKLLGEHGAENGPGSAVRMGLRAAASSHCCWDPPASAITQSCWLYLFPPISRFGEDFGGLGSNRCCFSSLQAVTTAGSR